MSDEVADAGATTVVPVAPFAWHTAMLQELVSERSLPHALLLTGMGGIGKRRLALALAQTLLCEARSENGLACGTCAGCRYVAAGQHPDLQRVEPVEYDDEGNATPVEWINVQRVRELTRWVQVTSHRGRAKVAIIAPADRMNNSAANALLKTLEEPPADTYLLLVSDQPGRLPATIVSRCRRVPVPRPPREAASRWLAGQGVESPEILLAQAGGAPVLALQLADRGHQQERAAWLSALAQPARLSPVQVAARIDAQPRDARKGLLGAAIEWLIAWCADLAVLHAGGSGLRNPDHAAALSALARTVAPAALFRYHRTLLAQRALLSHPLQPRLCAEALLIEYQGLFQ